MKKPAAPIAKDAECDKKKINGGCDSKLQCGKKDKDAVGAKDKCITKEDCDTSKNAKAECVAWAELPKVPLSLTLDGCKNLCAENEKCSAVEWGPAT